MKLLLLFAVLASALIADTTQVVTLGSKWILTASFTKPVSNPPDTVYRIQWLKGASAISGATSTQLPITINSLADLGSYSYHVTATHPLVPTPAERVNSDKGILTFVLLAPESRAVVIAPAPAPVVP
jgi:hypothetical protein